MTSFITRYALARIATLLCALSMGAAQADIEIVSATLDTQRTDKLAATLVLSLSDAQGTPRLELQAADLSLSLTDQAVTPESATLTPFEQGSAPVAVVFVLPTAKDYPEKDWKMRAVVAEAMATLRPIDHVGAIGYDATAVHRLEAAPGAGAKAAETLKAWEVSDDKEKPHLYDALKAGLKMLKPLDGVSFKYLVVVTDAAGQITTTMKVDQVISQFREFADGRGVTPIVVAYHPSGELEHLEKLKALGASPEARLIEAQSPDGLKTALEQARRMVYGHHVLDVVIDPVQDGTWLEPGIYHVGVAVGSDKAEHKVELHELDNPAPPAKASEEEPSGFCSARAPVTPSPVWLGWLLMAVGVVRLYSRR